MNARFGSAALAVLAMVLSAASATASTLVRTYNFTASNFYSYPNGTPPPVNTVAGSVTVAFDPAVSSALNETNGIALNNINIPLGSAVAFEYFALPTDILFVGGVYDDVNGTQGGTNDFVLILQNASKQTVFGGFYFVNTTNPNYVWFANTFQATVSDVPEPESWLLMLSGVGLLGLAVRRRRQGFPVG